HCASRSPTRTRFDDDGCVTSGHVVLGRMAAPVYRGPSAAGAAEGERQLDSTILGTAGFGLKCSFGEREQPQVLLHVIARLTSISSPSRSSFVNSAWSAVFRAFSAPKRQRVKARLDERATRVGRHAVLHPVLQRRVGVVALEPGYSV